MTSSSTLIFNESLKSLEKKAPLLKVMLSLEREYSVLHLQKKISKKLNFLNRQENQVQVIFAYGLGSENDYQQLLVWLEKNEAQSLFICMEGLKEFKALLSKEVGSVLVRHPKTHWLYLNSPHFWSQNQKLLQSHLGIPFKICNLELQPTQAYDSFKEQLTQLCLEQNSVFTEYIYTSPLIYKNIFANLKKMNGSMSISPFKNRFANRPAILCGAGPSMQLQAKELGQYRDRALIFAGGRALSVLSSENIEPHFCVGIDPYSMHRDTFAQNLFFETPLIYRSRIDSDVLDLSQSFKIRVPQSVGYPLTEWLEDRLGLFSEKFQEGLNVVNFSAEIARYMGCSPIILVGCDLCYQNSKSYSESALLNQSLPQMNSFDDCDYTIHRTLHANSNSQKRVFTLWKWSEEAKWLSDFAVKNTGCRFFNTSQNGLEIKGFEYSSFSNLFAQYPKNQTDFSHQINQICALAQKEKLTSEQIQKLENELTESLQTCARLFCKKNTSDFHSLAKIQLQEEIAYQQMLKPLEQLFDRVELKSMSPNTHQRKNKFLKMMCEKYLDVLEN